MKRKQDSHQEEYRRSGPRRIFCRVLLIGACLISCSAGAAEPNVTAGDIIRKMSVHADEYWNLTRSYTFLVDVLVEDYESDGELKKHTTTTERLYHYYGRRFFRKISENGEPLAEKALKQENTRESKFRLKTQKAVANADSSDLYGRMDQQAIKIEDLVARYDYTLAGIDTVQGRDVFVVHFAPRPGLEAKKRRDKIFNELQGTVWIDTSQYRIVKSVGRLRKDVRIGWIAAKITNVEINYGQQEIGPGIWMPLFVDARLEGTIFFFKKINRLTSANFYEFTKTDVDVPGYLVGENATTGDAR